MRLIRTISTLAASSLALAACMGDSAPPPVTAIPTSAAACEAMRPAFPILFHGKTDAADTVVHIKAANARFAGACP